jgi:hypothetical protein
MIDSVNGKLKMTRIKGDRDELVNYDKCLTYFD